MNIKSLSLKNKLIDDRTGENYFDFSAPSFLYKAEFGVKAIHYVLPDQEGRLDKISLIYYGSAEFIDAICIVNNIFNPFSLQTGDVLVIPNLSREELVYSRPKTITRPNSVQGPYINTNVQNEIDQSRIQRLLEKAKNKKSGVSNPLPPNVLQPGQNAKEFIDGNILLGINLNTKK